MRLSGEGRDDNPHGKDVAVGGFLYDVRPIVIREHHEVVSGYAIVGYS